MPRGHPLQAPMGCTTPTAAPAAARPGQTWRASSPTPGGGRCPCALSHPCRPSSSCAWRSWGRGGRRGSKVCWWGGELPGRAAVPISAGLPCSIGACCAAGAAAAAAAARCMLRVAAGPSGCAAQCVLPCRRKAPGRSCGRVQAAGSQSPVMAAVPCMTWGVSTWLSVDSSLQHAWPPLRYCLAGSPWHESALTAPSAPKHMQRAERLRCASGTLSGFKPPALSC